ncbi:MAG TPA: PVC-type heme-binding CxxCH protein [Prosthecobacter sp.]
MRSSAATFFCCLLLAPVLALRAEPLSLFDGKTLTGWDYDPNVWRVEDGMITGGSRTEKIQENYFICTHKSYQNFDLRLKIKCSGDPATGMINSGIQIRSLRVPGGNHMSGYQVDCGKGWFGKIYDEFRRNKVIAEPLDAAALDKAVDVYGWNEYRIRAEGPRIQVWINGVASIDYTETDPNVARDGQLGPQVHSGGACLVQVKDVTLEELPPTPDAPTWQSLGGVEAARKRVTPPAKTKEDAGSKPKRDISYNNVQSSAKSAAEQLKLFHLPKGYEIELVVQESEGLGKFVSVYFDQRGRLWTQTAFEYPVDGNENPAAAEVLYQGKGKDKVVVFPREALSAPLPPGGLTNPAVYADGLAIPLGILPWGNGDACYIQHGHDLKLFKDTDGDGRADTSEVILTGFGVQDSHLFPHQFTRAPGGWIWMAQGLFNNSEVHKPGSKDLVDYPKCGMARMRPDGSGFEVTSVGPNNIWGLVITGEGETFIQEANDYGYPVMPFHEYAYYPGGMEALKKSYQPDFPPQTEFRMGGTGLSGLALIEGGPLLDEKAAHTMAVANPITSKIQTLSMHRDGSYWKLQQKPDLITCDDPFFRPVALTNGPDGCIYIVDWYNKIISHNEVPRNHPDRDKTRGRIWRVRPSDNTKDAAGSKGAAVSSEAGKSTRAPLHASGTIPDFTKLSTDELVAMLGKAPLGRAHLAWQTLADRPNKESLSSALSTLPQSPNEAAKLIQALWALEGSQALQPKHLAGLAESTSANVRRERIRMIGITESSTNIMVQNVVAFRGEKDPAARFQAIQHAADVFAASIADSWGDKLFVEQAFAGLLAFAEPSLVKGPTIQSSRGARQIPVHEAYDREFERFLVRMFLERQPEAVVRLLDSDAPTALPIEARVLASLALDPKTSAPRVSRLLPQLGRAPNDEELLRLAQFPDEPGVGEALKTLLAHQDLGPAVAEKLLAKRTLLDSTRIAPILKATAVSMLQSRDVATRKQALTLCAGFQIMAEDVIVPPLAQRQQRVFDGKPVPSDDTGEITLSLAALAATRSQETQLFYVLAESDPDRAVRDAALDALIAASTNVVQSACERLFKLYPKLQPVQRKRVLTALSGQAEGGAKALLSAILDKTVPQNDLDGPVLERLATVLGNDPSLVQLQQQLGGVFREVLALDGQDTAWVDSKITLEGPFTVECWVRLNEGIGNQDGILGSPGQIDMNFYGSKFRVWVADQGLHDVVVAKKPVTAELWTHVAVTRDAQGTFRLYQNGELDSVGNKKCGTSFKDCRVAWTQPKDGTRGALAEYRVWNRARTAQEIRQCFDRMGGAASDRTSLIYASAEQWQPAAKDALKAGARLVKSLDTPPLLSEEQAHELESKFTRYTALAQRGKPEAGKPLAALCLACHQIGSTGGQIGPNLSGAGAMGLEPVLRNILTPNAAMEPGYRIFRLEMNNGDLLDAFYVNEDTQAYVVRQPGMADRRVPKKDVRSTRYIRRSLMPEGLLDSLNEQQAADLLAYLMTLKG